MIEQFIANITFGEFCLARSTITLEKKVGSTDINSSGDDVGDKHD